MHTVIIPEVATASAEKDPANLDELTTERLQAAYNSLVSLRMPGSAIRPYKAILDGRRAK